MPPYQRRPLFINRYLVQPHPRGFGRPGRQGRELVVRSLAIGVDLRLATEECFIGGEEDRTSVCAAHGEEFGVGGGGRAERGFDVEGGGVEVAVAEAV